MMPPRRHTPRACLLLALVTIAPLLPVYAAWETVPDAKLSVENNDNLLRSAVNEVDASRTLVDASVDLRNETERSLLYLQPRIVTDAYAESENEIYESDDLFLRAGGQHRRQTGAEAFQLSYSDQSTIRSEFAGAVPLDPDAPLPPDVDSGRLDAVLQQQRLSFFGNLDFQLSERNGLRVETSRTNVQYEDRPAGSSYSDFDDTAVSLRYVHDLDQRNQLTTRLVGSQFNADRNDNRSDSMGIELGFLRRLSQTWTLNLAVGAQDTDFQFIDPNTQILETSSGTNSTFGLGFRRRAERTTLNLNLNRELSPNSNGFLAVRDSFRLYVRHAMTPRINGYLGALYVQTNLLDGGAASQSNRNYSRFEIGLDWVMTQRIYLNFAYNRLTQEFSETSGATADSNTFILGVGYRGLRRR